jgi:hypothetical protein
MCGQSGTLNIVNNTQIARVDKIDQSSAQDGDQMHVIVASELIDNNGNPWRLNGLKPTSKGQQRAVLRESLSVGCRGLLVNEHKQTFAPGGLVLLVRADGLKNPDRGDKGCLKSRLARKLCC